MKYNVIYCDPPWSYNNKKTGGKLDSGSCQKYSTLSIQQLFDINVQSITENNSVLFLWATTPLLNEAFQLIDAWGFTYKTTITWVKCGRLGMGFWLRVNTEHLLVAVKGQVKPFRCSKRNVISHKTIQHSEKPEIFRELIEECTNNMPDRKMLELFARKQSSNWDCWGLELDGTDIVEKLKNRN